MTVLISIGMWCVLVYSLRVAALGNPLAKLLYSRSREELEHAEEAVRSGPEAVSHKELNLLRRFSRLTLLELVVFLLEAGILIYLIAADMLLWVSAGLLAKDAVALLVSLACTRRAAREDGMLSGFLKLPRWLHVADRISAAVSAVGFLYLFLAYNQILGLGAPAG